MRKLILIIKFVAFFCLICVYCLFIKYSWSYIIYFFEFIHEETLKNFDAFIFLRILANSFALACSLLTSLCLPILILSKVYGAYTDNKKAKNDKKMLLEQNSKRKELEEYNNSIMNITERKVDNYYKKIKV